MILDRMLNGSVTLKKSFSTSGAQEFLWIISDRVSAFNNLYEEKKIYMKKMQLCCFILVISKNVGFKWIKSDLMIQQLIVLWLLYLKQCIGHHGIQEGPLKVTIFLSLVLDSFIFQWLFYFRLSSKDKQECKWENSCDSEDEFLDRYGWQTVPDFWHILLKCSSGHWESLCPFTSK